MSHHSSLISTGRQVPFYVMVFAALSLSCLACGTRPKSDPSVRERLRARADQASDFDYDKPMGRRRSKAKPSSSASTDGRSSRSARSGGGGSERLPSGVSCSDQLACFPQDKYLVAEGVGATRREAETDAATRLTAQIKSEVSSVIRLQISESDAGGESETSGQIERTVKTHFTRGELIRYLPAQGARGDQFTMWAYLDRDRYHEEVIDQLAMQIDEMNALMRRMSSIKGGERFVRVWGDLNRILDELRPGRSEYRAVMGRDLPRFAETWTSFQTLSKRAAKLRRSTRFVIEISELEQAGASLRTLLKELVKDSGIQARLPGICLEGQYLIKVEGGTEKTVNQITGGEMMKLRWQSTLYRCGDKEGDLSEIAQVEFPEIKGVERYQQSAEQVIQKRVKTILGHVKEGTPVSPGAPPHGAPAQANQLKSSFRSLISQVVPLKSAR